MMTIATNIDEMRRGRLAGCRYFFLQSAIPSCQPVR
jgi:hypothetical protein